MPRRTRIALVLLAGVLGGCSADAPARPTVSELRRFPLDGSERVLTETGVTVDQAVSSDGNGSLRIDATQPTTVRLFEVDGVNVDNAVLTYRAKLRSEMVEGQAYLEMWVQVRGVGEAFSRALHAPLSGTVDWTSQETPFFLEAGQTADLVKLNLVIDGTGTVWIDDIHLLRASR